MDRVLNILTKQAQNPTVAAYNPVVSIDPSRGPASRKSDDWSDRTDVLQMIRQELRRANSARTNFQQAQNRNQRTFDGRPTTKRTKRRSKNSEFKWTVQSKPQERFAFAVTLVGQRKSADGSCMERIILRTRFILIPRPNPWLHTHSKKGHGFRSRTVL